MDPSISAFTNVITATQCVQLDGTLNKFVFKTPCAPATGICESKLGNFKALLLMFSPK
jgi:hypothetical protein